jgi:rhodanese-related sulfurtransferase
MSSETWSTLGEQKETNYALRADMSREAFIKEVTDGLLPPPQYFAKNAQLNKTGYTAIDEVMERGAQALRPAAFEAVANEHGALILDVRSKEKFVKGFVPNSIFIGLDGSFAPWVGALITDLQQPILIVAPEGREEETVTRLARVGYDNALGYLRGGIPAWIAAGREVDTIETISLKTFAKRFKENPNLSVLDVRKPSEWEAEHLENSQNFPLDFINAHMHEIQREQSYHLHCRSGYRSTVAASILKARGFQEMVNVQANFAEFSDVDLPLTAFVCPSTLK